MFTAFLMALNSKVRLKLQDWKKQSDVAGFIDAEMELRI